MKQLSVKKFEEDCWWKEENAGINNISKKRLEHLIRYDSDDIEAQEYPDF
jgi:hypothetical protein